VIGDKYIQDEDKLDPVPKRLKKVGQMTAENKDGKLSFGK
jgi:hypothetical protein